MTQWRDMKTVPKDGTRILVFDPDYPGQIAACSYDSYSKWVERGHDYTFEVWGVGQMNPTHWMPLPSPPEQSDP